MAPPPDVARAAVKRVLWTTLVLNLLVSAAKIAVGTLSGSMSMVADGYHSLIDGINNVVGIVVASFAYAPPDAGHPYGHRKFETATRTRSAWRSCVASSDAAFRSPRSTPGSSIRVTSSSTSSARSA
jgi:hypothetical protein